MYIFFLQGLNKSLCMYLHFFFRSIYCTVIFGMSLQKICRGVNENRMFVQICKYFFYISGSSNHIS